MAELIGNEAGLIIFQFEAIYPRWRDMSTLLQYGRNWVSHHVQEEPLRSVLSKLGLIIMSATDGNITTEGLSPHSERANVSHWKLRVSKMLDYFMEPANRHSVKLYRVAEVSVRDYWGNETTFPLTGDHIAQLDSPRQWLTDDCIQAVILCSTKECDCIYVPPSVLLSLRSDPNATKPDWDNAECEMSFLVVFTTDGSSDRGGNHFACAAVTIDYESDPAKAAVQLLESYQLLGLCDQYKAQIRCWLGDFFDIKFHVQNVFQQRDTYNCGVHVIAQGISFINTCRIYRGDLWTVACSTLRNVYRNVLQSKILELHHQEVDDPDITEGASQPPATPGARASSSRDIDSDA